MSRILPTNAIKYNDHFIAGHDAFRRREINVLQFGPDPLLRAFLNDPTRWRLH
ncbi:MAG TPA: hypothetical protein VMQ76_01590 [Terracidiphilus sp.]|nr:hypothetical protein [Terracidiphilus sp.]